MGKNTIIRLHTVYVKWALVFEWMYEKGTAGRFIYLYFSNESEDWPEPERAPVNKTHAHSPLCIRITNKWKHIY